MATLREYFDTDFPSVLNTASKLSLTVKGASAATFEVPARVHYDFDSGTKYISYFVSSGPESSGLFEALIMNPHWPFDAMKGVAVQAGYPGERMIDAADLKFPGRIFLYTEDLLSDEQAQKLHQTAKGKGIDLVMRTRSAPRNVHDLKSHWHSYRTIGGTRRILRNQSRLD